MKILNLIKDLAFELYGTSLKRRILEYSVLECKEKGNEVWYRGVSAKSIHKAFVLEDGWEKWSILHISEALEYLRRNGMATQSFVCSSGSKYKITDEHLNTFNKQNY